MNDSTDNTEHDAKPGAGCPRGVAIALNIAIGLALVLTVLAWIRDPLELFLGPTHLTVSKGIKPIVLTVLLVVSRVLAGWRGRGIARGTCRVLGSGWVLKPAMAICSVLFFFAAFEGVLALTGFQFDLPPIVIKGAEGSDGTERYMIPDPELRWRLNPGATYHGRPVNQMGFFDREVDPVKRPGSKRVICLGDSCTGQGIPPYSGYLNDMLVENPPTDQPWECFNMGVHGYSSAQGLRNFQNRGPPLKPDVVSIYFGWNDHWLSGGASDGKRMPMGMSKHAAGAAQKLRGFRFFQFMMRALNPVRDLVEKDGLDGLRVPPAEYEWTLTEMVREIRKTGADAILLTAPRAEKLTPLLIKNGQTKDLDAVTKLHDDYVDIVRKVARDNDVVLVDMAAMLAGPEHAGLFSKDGIHLTSEGRMRVAEELYKAVSEIASE